MNFLEQLTHRLLAFLADFAIIYLAGLCFLIIISGGVPEKYIVAGVSISVFQIYFSIFSSNLASGQSPGKRFFKLKVTKANGEFISVYSSFARTFILNLQISCTAFYFPLTELYGQVGWMLWIGTIVCVAVTELFFVLLTKGQQSLHDYLLGTWVTDPLVPERAQLKSSHAAISIACGFASFILYLFYFRQYIWPQQ